MATYKKRGYKKGKGKDQHPEEMNSATAEVFKTLDEQASKSEAWVARNQKYIIGGIGVIVILVLGYLGYEQFVQGPKETEATNEMFYAQQYFDQAVNATDKDSLYTLALEGAEGKYGLLDIIEEYKGTKAANLANYSAGMAYLNMQRYEEAIQYLQEFSSDDMMLGALAQGGIGDAFMQLNQPEDALDYYEKAIKQGDNNFTTPRYLYKAGTTALELGQKDKALGYFQRIKDDYATSKEGRTIDIFIGKAENLN